MKSLTAAVLIVVFAAIALIVPRQAVAQQSSVNFQVFYDELSPYGVWVDYPNYGYVWIPSVDPGFSPYASAGHWVFTEDGWTWVSDYPWGWAPFHYGRWDYIDGRGWFWVPDDVWGPAWVSWRRSPGYYGWAPLRPGISVSVSFGKEYHERNGRWNFVREGDITRSDISRHYVNRSNNRTIINRSTVIVNTRKDDRRNATYIAGPERDDIQKVTHTPVASVAIRENDRPGHHLSNSELQIYRPTVDRRGGNGHNPTPAKVMRLDDVKPAAGRAPAGHTEVVKPKVNVVTQQPSRPTAEHSPRNRNNGQQVRTATPQGKGQSQPARVVRPAAPRRVDRQTPNAGENRKNRESRTPEPRENQHEPGKQR